MNRPLKFDIELATNEDHYSEEEDNYRGQGERIYFPNGTVCEKRLLSKFQQKLMKEFDPTNVSSQKFLNNTELLHDNICFSEE